MAYYAFIDKNNIVQEVISGRDEGEVVGDISDWEEYYSTKRPGMKAVRTSINTLGGIHYSPEDGSISEDQSKAFRYNFAGIDFLFDETKGNNGAFIPPQPFSSWILNEETCLWEAPVPMPIDENEYAWDENSRQWVIINS